MPGQDQERVVKITVQAGSSEQALKQLNSELRKTENSLQRMGGKAANDAKSGFGKVSRSAGQAGIQFQQFIGQVQGGQSAMLAFSQQSADLGIVLGAPLLGAIAGISASIIGILIPTLFTAGNAMKELEGNTASVAENFGGLNKVQKDLVNQSFLIQITKINKELEKQDKAVLKSMENIDAKRKQTLVGGRGVVGTARPDSKSIKESADNLIAAQIAALNLRLELEKIKRQQDALKVQKGPGEETIDKLRVISEKELFSRQADSDIRLGIMSQEMSKVFKWKQEESNKLDTLRETELEKFIGTNEQKLALIQAFKKRENAINVEFNSQKEQQDSRLIDKEKSLKISAMNAVSGFGQQMMSESQGRNKAMFEASKALSLASAIAALPAAVMATYKQYGATPWGAAAAAGMAITGAINIAKIASTKFESKSGTAATTNTATTSSGPGFAPPVLRNTQTERTSTNALLNELREWSGGDLIPIEYARKIAESLAEVSRQGGT